jgi:hypothetical protein
MGENTLGDAGVPNTDLLYTGDVSSSPFSLDYYRNKAREFQDVLNGMDRTFVAIGETLRVGVDEQTTRALVRSIEEFQAKKATMKLTAEAINAGAALVNSMGGRFPVLSVPGTLGIAPIVLPVATIAAIGTAATLAVWGRDWIRGVNERLKTAQLINAQDSPAAQAALARSIAATDAALAQAEGSIWAVAGTGIKWVALAVVAFLAYKAFAGSKWAAE